MTTKASTSCKHPPNRAVQPARGPHEWIVKPTCHYHPFLRDSNSPEIAYNYCLPSGFLIRCRLAANRDAAAPPVPNRPPREQYHHNEVLRNAI